MWLHSSVGRALHRYRGGHGFESRWSPDFCQASSFQLLKLEKLLQWSHFTFIYYRSTNMNYFIYSSHDFTAREDMNSINWPCSQCVASYSSVGRASHWYRRGHGFESRWSRDFFQAFSFQLLKLENLLRWSHFTFIYYCSTNMNYFTYISHVT